MIDKKSLSERDICTKYFVKFTAFFVLLFVSYITIAQDSYITKVDLNLRSGAGKNYKSIKVLEKGDTVKLLESSSNYWVKIQYQNKIGYSAKQHLQKIEVIKKIESESNSGYIIFLVCLLFVLITTIILYKLGKKYRHKSTATILSFFFGAFGFQKFYLGETNKGTYSILFCWTFIPSFIGLIDFIKLALMHENKFNDNYNWGKSSIIKTSKLLPKSNLESNTNNITFAKQEPSIVQTQNKNYMENLTIVKKSGLENDIRQNGKLTGYGNIYQKELGLNMQEVDWLNKVKVKPNEFLLMNGCIVHVLNTYIQLLYKITEMFIGGNSTLQKELKRLEQLVIKDFKESGNGSFDWDKYEGNTIYKEIENEAHNNLFKKAENAVRKVYGYRKELKEEFKYLPLILENEFNTKIGSLAVEALNKIKPQIPEPDNDTQIELNKKNKNRWKIEFDELIKQFEVEKKQVFLNGLLKLEKTNKENPFIGNIFFEASKFIAHIDKEIALKLYAKYIYFDEITKNYQLKKLPKRIEDLLFETAQQHLEFLDIQKELHRTHNISHAYSRIEELVSIQEIEKQENNGLNEEEVDTETQNFAKKAYPNDIEMQKYVYNEQIDSKKFMKSANDVELIEFAQGKYPDDFSMQEYVYKEQAESKVYMSKVKDKEVLSFALEQYPDDYSMQEYIYKEQVKSKAFMKKASNIEIKQFANSEYPEDYSMQEYIYNGQVALPENERAKIEVDNTIIDINSENLDLSVEHNINDIASDTQPPYWGHTYVYSYDEIKHATKAQKQFYTYFKNHVANGEYVDIQGSTNYAFILYFDFLNEYQGHRDIKLLDEQFKLLASICPKTRSYSLRSLQDELRKRSDSYSVDKLKDLEEPNYQFEHGYSDYNPDLYKLGNQYKDKLGLNKQEVIWLNKFYNPTNVFLSIEGCCIATIMQFVTILKELEKQLKKQETTFAKEVTYFKEKLKAIYAKMDSDWGYYDTSYFGNRAESEVYLTMFKRVENSVRESFGHKRKVSGVFPYADKSLSEEFETKLGASLNTLIEELKGNVGQPNLETQIELNTQNVNRWRIELDELIVAYKQEDIRSFIGGVIHIEETNQKNPNIENIFYQASKFISKYDNVQSLKYYAKYIYYDLKSKKFDNKELTKTVQKSLFKTEEQIKDFKEIIADLIATNDIQTALDKISKIYIPKRKRIQLDRSEIQEVEQKHEGTVELLNEYLVEEKETLDIVIDDKTEENIEIAIISSVENNSIFISEISMGQVQEELVKMIIHNSYEIHQDEVDKYAAANGMFKNQLIDSINEACEEHLDGEALIEEDDENYIIEESYYKEIAK
ncbi:MAG: SH3 domain-containing protein [Salinivirgaceae bacterium]|nr:SH3 domain-containing protein [Salinivirgaceae bacterium]